MLYHGWTAVQTMTEFRKRRDVRPNDDFIDQLIRLDNQLKRNEKDNIRVLKDIPSLPKPWHFEFWTEIPKPSEIPFQLIQLGEPAEAFDCSIGVLNPQLASLNADETNCVSEDHIFCDEKKSYNLAHIELADLNPFKFSLKEFSNKSRTESESSWEYYTDSDDN